MAIELGELDLGRRDDARQKAVANGVNDTDVTVGEFDERSIAIFSELDRARSEVGKIHGEALHGRPGIGQSRGTATAGEMHGRNLVYQFWIHTETIGRMWNWVEFIFNTPSHHRVHHATNPRYLDANYAGTLIVWDRMFGTFVEELEEDRPRYGIVKNIGTFNPVKVAFHEWIGMFKDAFSPGLTLGQRLRYLFMPPGWSHDGSRDTSETLKAAYVRRNPTEAGKPGLPGRKIEAAE